MKIVNVTRTGKLFGGAGNQFVLRIYPYGIDFHIAQTAEAPFLNVVLSPLISTIQPKNTIKKLALLQHKTTENLFRQ